MNTAVTHRLQSGYVLVTALILLLVLTLVAISTMDFTTTETRMVSNATVRSRALESSEAIRGISGSLLDAYIYNRGWPESVGGTIDNDTFNTTIPSGLTIADVNNSLYTGNSASENIFNPATLTNDISFSVDGNGDGDYTDDIDVQATLSVFKLNTVSNPGAGTCQVCGYEGTGKSAAASGASIYFDLRATGVSANGARVVTNSEYRYVVRN